jgi:hypothetical protein
MQFRCSTHARADGSRGSKARYVAYKKELAKCQQGGLGVNTCQNLMERYMTTPGAP